MISPESNSANSEANLSKKSPPDIFAGAIVGLLMGTLTGAACAWLVGADDIIWEVALVGSVIGLVGGVGLGFRHRMKRLDCVSSNIGNTICLVYPLLASFLILLGGIGMVKGKFSGLLVAGAAFAFPMAGMMIGAVVDRLYEDMPKDRYSEP